MTDSLKAKLAGLLQYLKERIDYDYKHTFHATGQIEKFLDDPEVAQFLDQQNKQGNVSRIYFSRNT